MGMNSSYITALPDDWERVARVFSAMGDATRQRILLLFEPGESISLSSLVATVGLSRTAVSHHVNVLVRAGLNRVALAPMQKSMASMPLQCSWSSPQPPASMAHTSRALAARTRRHLG